MKDTHETRLPGENLENVEETKAPEVTPDGQVEETTKTETSETHATTHTQTETEESNEHQIDEATVIAIGKLSKAEILEKLVSLVEAASDTSRNEVEALKHAYYKLHRAEIEEAKKAFLENGGTEEEFVAPQDPSEAQFKNLLATYKEKRAAILAEEERIKEANYEIGRAHV